MTNADFKKHADRLLYEFGLLEKLNECGTAHLIGSYRMDMMAWNDLDIDIENDQMSLEKLYQLSFYILDIFHPVWYEAKEEVTPDGRTVWFHGFETKITGELWNVDLWFFDKETIEKAEAYCKTVTSGASQEQKEQIVRIKQELLARGLYSFGQYTSIDVYTAVLEHQVTTIEEFLSQRKSE